eukprot:Protomagalhaensia_wolfi_Nauph_80__2655@NODE_2794_length_985_cov_330_475687_g2192_i0_p1_GENE_NODE_2794_length_985_cov_330_475687_g2192_i0NODE_2794_length_985_cov_330_475687_g2192_i0_p1_ORF_typecomplete_len267_score22_36_NODE_2794_length_985_cov_330_475687_g2192_i0138938
MMQLLWILSVAVLRSKGVSLNYCEAAAVIESPLIRATVFATDKYIILKAAGGSATVADIYNCTGAEGLSWQVLDSIDDKLTATCRGQRIYNPNMMDPVRHRALCTPSSFERDPFICLPGDWSGKFRNIQLAQRPSSMSGMLFPHRDTYASHPPTPPDLTSAEFVRVFEDPLPIPACLLQHKAISFSCADGRVAGCSFFKLLSDNQPAPKAQRLENLLNFLTYTMPTPVQYGDDRSWSDKFTSSDYWGHLWDDFKRRSRDFWESGAP